MNIICDTSFLLVLVSKPIKCIDNVELAIGKLNFIVPEFVLEELDSLERNKGPKKAMAAKKAIEVARSEFEIRRITKVTNVDNDIIKYAMNNKFGVATLDSEMIRRLVKSRILVITLTNNKMIVANRYD